MPKDETSRKPQDSRAAGGGLVDPRDLKDNSSEPLPLPDEPATEPRGDDDRESSGDDRVRSPACGIVDPRLSTKSKSII